MTDTLRSAGGADVVADTYYEVGEWKCYGCHRGKETRTNDLPVGASLRDTVLAQAQEHAAACTR